MSATPPFVVVHETVARLAAKVIAQDKRIAILSRRIDELNRAVAANARGGQAMSGKAAACERRRVAVHEASHAVAALIVGGKARVRLTTARDADASCVFSGLTTVSTTTRARGFVAAAGVAGETKFCEAAGLAAPPPACVAADLQCVDENAPDADPAAFYSPRELELERARRAFDDPAVWGAVLWLAEALKGVWPDEEAAEGAGSFTREMSAERVAAICRDAGLRETSPVSMVP